MTSTASPEHTTEPDSESAAGDAKRVDYLFECYRIANEETFLRFKYREHWLEIQLLAQLVLLALSQGVEIAGVKALSTIPDVLALSPAIALVLVSLYYVDDSIITYLGNYIGALTDAEATLRPGAWKILNWNASDQVRHYVARALPLKYLAQLVAFAIIPAGLFGWRVSGFSAWGALQIIEVAVDSVFLILICYVVWHGFRRRSDAYFKSRAGVLVPMAPPEQNVEA